MDKIHRKRTAEFRFPPAFVTGVETTIKTTCIVGTILALIYVVAIVGPKAARNLAVKIDHPGTSRQGM